MTERPAAGPSMGLTSGEAAERLRRLGPNALPEAPAERLWRRFVRQFRSALIYILLVALLVNVALWVYDGARGVPVESIAIGLILLLNAGLGTAQEYRSEAALARLKKLSAPQAWVLRDGKLVRAPGHEIVPGDVVRIEAGDRVPADGRLVDPQGVMVDESVLTGESVPVDKGVGDEVFSGTLVVRGKALAEVSRTGSSSAMGRLATLLGGIEVERTPLERRLDVFGRQVAKAVLVIGVLLVVGGTIAEGVARFPETFLFAVALAVAAVPEGLPAVLSLTLALGVERMARRRAVVRRLVAVEALGSVTVIATDKTGTLTENRMFVRALDAPEAAPALRAMVLANDADVETGAGDPLEVALLEYARSQGLDIAAVREAAPRVGTRPFDSAWKYARVTVDEGSRRIAYLKGAPEVILSRSAMTVQERQAWSDRAQAHARGGHRVLALATGADDTDERLSFLGFVTLWDPPRAEVPDAIRRAQQAGVRVLMITGDHPATAHAVARSIGIRGDRVVTGADLDGLSADDLARLVGEANVYARVDPEHKLRIVEALKARGDIVAVTGDGVNDAPALKRADVGVAMGHRGSDVTREVADLVLLDDNFATIVAAIEEGRSIYENVQKFIRFLLSTNLALVLLVVGGAVGSILLGLENEEGNILLPLTAVQLLWINFVGDGPPALALGLDRNPGVMREPPRPPEAGLLDRPSLRFIALTGVAKASTGLLLLVALPLAGLGAVATRTGVFVYESLVQLVFAYPSRRARITPRPNPSLHVSVLLGVAITAAALFLAGPRDLLGLVPLPAGVLAALAAAVFLTWGAAEVTLRFGRRRAHAGGDGDAR